MEFFEVDFKYVWFSRDQVWTGTFVGFFNPMVAIFRDVTFTSGGDNTDVLTKACVPINNFIFLGK